MITLEKEIDFPDTYPLGKIGELGGILFFDIETTGFSGEFSSLYLIGCAFCEDGEWKLVQWFADSLGAERDVLVSFFEFLKKFSTVVHFNGDGFDIPYLLKRCKALGLDYDFSGVVSVDIYKRIRPYRKLLGLESMRQKAIEQFLGVDRTDIYSGGQLIEVYHDYLVSHEQALFDMLILHNEDDLKGMPSILPILYYPDFLEGCFVLERQDVIEEEDVFGRPLYVLRLVCQGDTFVPAAFSMSNSLAVLEADGNRLTVSVDLYQGELKYFYPDFKNYYYLTYEDRAIHRSVAEYVDKEARVKATAKTCYTRQEGLYLPQFEELWQPCLVREYKDKVFYTAFYDGFFKEQPERIDTYIRHLLAHIG